MDYRRHIRLVIFSVIVQGIFYLRNILLLPILTRALGPEMYGVWGKLHGLCNLLVPVVGLGVVEGVRRFVPSAAGAEQRCFFLGALKIILAGGMTATGVFVLIARSAARVLLLDSSVEVMTRFMSGAVGLVLLLGALNVLCMTYLQCIDRPRWYGAYILAHVCALVGSALFGWRYGGASQWMPIGAWLIGLGLPVIVCVISVLINTGDAAADPAGKAGAGRPAQCNTVARMIRFGAPLIPMTGLIWLMHSADRYMIPWLRPELGNHAVGVYTANYALGGVVAMVFAPFWLFFSPTVARLWDRGEREQARHLSRQTVKFGMILIWPVLLCAPILGGSGIRLITGMDAFQARAPVIFLVMLGYALHMLADVVQTGFALQRKSWRILVNALLATACNIGLNCVLVPRPGFWGGLTGAALATAASFGIYLMLGGLTRGESRGLSLGWHALVRVALCALTAAACVRFLAVYTPMSAAILMGCVIYALLLVGLDVIKRSELAALRAVAGK